MKLRIVFVSALFLFLAGAAMATPTVADAPDPGVAGLVAAWEIEPVATPVHGYALAAPAPVQEPTELAAFGPCGCTPIPGCPFPIPFPLPGPFGPTIFNPFPTPGSCTCPLPF